MKVKFRQVCLLKYISSFSRCFYVPRHTGLDSDTATRSSYPPVYHSQHYLEICAPVLGVHQVHTKWMNGSCFVHPNLMVLTYPCCETEQALVHIKSLPLLPFDTLVLNYNPGIYYLLLQKTDKAFLLLNTVNFPFCPHIEKPITVFKKWPSMNLSFIMFLCIRGSPFLFLTPCKYPYWYSE